MDRNEKLIDMIDKYKQMHEDFHMTATESVKKEKEISTLHKKLRKTKYEEMIKIKEENKKIKAEKQKMNKEI